MHSRQVGPSLVALLCWVRSPAPGQPQGDLEQSHSSPSHLHRKPNAPCSPEYSLCISTLVPGVPGSPCVEKEKT